MLLIIFNAWISFSSSHFGQDLKMMDEFDGWSLLQLIHHSALLQSVQSWPTSAQLAHGTEPRQEVLE